MTARGVWFVLVGLATGVLAVVLRERDLVFVAVLALLLPLLAWLFTGTRRVPVTVEHLVPLRLQAGESGALRLLLHNPDRRRTRPLDVHQPGTRHLVDGVRRLVPPIGPGGTAEIVLPLGAERRGSYTVEAPRLRFRDPLGLAQVRRLLPAGAEVLVLPTVVTLVGLPRGLHGRGSSSGTSQGTGGYPDAGVRAYRSGDDVRTVHWRASARLEDELVVRVSGGTSLGEAALVLDHRAVAFEQGTEALEVAVTLAASVGRHLLEEDVELTVSDHRGTEIVAGHDVADDLLVALAAVGRDDGATAFAPTVPRSFDALVAIVAGLTEAEVRTLAALRRPGTAAVALVVGGPRDSPRSPAVVTSLLEAAGWRVVAIDVADAATADGGAHLAQAWRVACSSGARAAGEAARR